MMTIQFKTRRTLVWLLSVNLLWPLGAFAASQGDDFSDNIKNTSKWGTDDKFGHGVLTEKNQRLEYTCVGPTADDYLARRWILTRFPCNANWEMQVDTFNITVPTLPIQVNSAGITIRHPRTASKELYIELYSSQLGGPPSRTGFEFALDDGDTKAVASGAGGDGITNGAVRLVFNAATKVLTGYYDDDRTDGYQWTEFGSFGLAGAGGADGNADWGLADNDQFSSDLYGYSAFMAISSGQIFLDNFAETGGVTPSGAPTPDPVGRFPFGFPANNPLLTAIINLTGNYTGSTPTFGANGPVRTYDMDVAQDESGKLVVMGTIEGIANSQGGSEISSVGAATTVNAKPTMQLKTSFSGTGDGIPATSKSTGSSPAETTDIGGGSNVVAVALDVSAKLAGVPFRLKNTPVQFPADASYEANFQKKNWNLDLDIRRKVIKNKERTVASAQLLLPNGDTIAYPERVVRYSATKGYLLSFKRGTNVTINPSRIDKKSSISIKNLTFVQQGADWQPTGGAITYQFLGQKGTANLLDFVAP